VPGPRAPADRACGDLPELAQPSFEAPPPATIPESRITLEFDVALTRIERELSDRVPAVLDKGTRGIGRAGRVGYVVRRGPFNATLMDDRLVVTTLVTVNAQVCKPLGPFCPTYGSCSPTLRTKVSVPLVWQPDYRLGEAQVSLDIERSCSIAGFDATAQIRGTARRQAARVKRQLDAIVNRPPPQAAAAWQELHRPLPLPDGRCLRVTPSAITQARPRLTAGTITLQAAVSGALAFEQPCAAPSAQRVPPLPEPSVVDQLPGGVDVRLGVRRDWDALSAELTESLQGGADAKDGEAAEGLTITGVRARGVAIDGERWVALALDVDGCAAQWLVGRLAPEPRGARARLQDLRSPVAGIARAGRLDVLARHVERHGVVTLPLDLEATTRTARELLKRATAQTPPGVVVDVELTPAVLAELAIDDSGLVAVAKLGGRLHVRLP